MRFLVLSIFISFFATQVYSACDESPTKETLKDETAKDDKESDNKNGEEAASVKDTGSIKSAKPAANDDTEPEPKDTEIKNDTTKLEQPEEINQ